MNKKNGLKTALNRAMALCASREYCSADIRSKLESWGICTTEAEKIISGLIREMFLDDSRYAHAFVRDKFKYNKWGRMKIATPAARAASRTRARLPCRSTARATSPTSECCFAPNAPPLASGEAGAPPGSHHPTSGSRYAGSTHDVHRVVVHSPGGGDNGADPAMVVRRP